MPYAASLRPSALIRPCCLICLLLLALVGSASGLMAQDRLLVRTISILGNKRTQNQVILRELTFHPGDSIATADLQKLVIRNQQNLYNLGLFNDVSIHPEILAGDVYFFLTVQERWYIFPVPRIRVEERNTYDLIDAITRFDLHRFAYGLSLDIRNLTGRNETLYLYGQLGFSRRFVADFQRPAILARQNVDMTAGFNYIHEKEVIYGTEQGIVQWGRVENEPLQRSYTGYLGFRKRFSVYRSLLAEASYRSYRFADSLYQFMLQGETARYITTPTGQEHYPSLVINYAYDRRDVRAYPLSGIKYQVFFRVAGGPGSLATSRFAKAGATWAQHIPLSHRWNFAYGIHNVFTLGERLPYFEKNFIGINRREFPYISANLRGYEPYAIDGTFVNLTKFEFKYAILPRRIFHLEDIPFKRFQDMPLGIYLSAFGDFGYIADESFNDQDAFLKDKLLTGYGLGLNVIGIYDFLLRIEYARNHLAGQGVYLHATVPIK